VTPAAIAGVVSFRLCKCRGVKLPYVAKHAYQNVDVFPNSVYLQFSTVVNPSQVISDCSDVIGNPSKILVDLLKVITDYCQPTDCGNDGYGKPTHGKPPLDTRGIKQRGSAETSPLEFK
jgi:hypothetical protein